MAGIRNLMDHKCNETYGIEKYIGTSYDHLVKVSENMDTILFIARNIDSILEGVIVTTGDVIGQIQEEGENMLAGIQKDLERYLKLFEKDLDIKVEDKFSFIDETLTGIVHNSDFAIKQREFEARVAEVEQIIANDKQANAQVRKDLEAKYKENTAAIEDFKGIVAKEREVSGEYREKMDLYMYEGNAKLEEVVKAIVTEEEARILNDSLLSTRIGDNEASIKTLNTLVVTNTKAIAESINALHSEVGNYTADIESIRKTTADLESSQATIVEKVESMLEGVGDLEVNRSMVLLETLSETTNTFTGTSRSAVLSSQTNSNRVALDMQQMTLATESEVRAAQNLKLTAEVDHATSQLALEQLVLATEVETRAAQQLKLKVDFEDKVSELEQTQEVLANADETLAQNISKLSSKVDGNQSSFVEFQKTYANDKQTTSENISNMRSEIDTVIKTDIGDVKRQLASDIETVNKTISNLEKSTAENSLNLKTEVVAKIDRDFATANSNIDSLENRTNTKISNTEESLNNKITGVQGALTATEKEFNSLLGTRVTELSDKIVKDSNSARTNAVADSKKYTDSSVNKVNTTISAEIKQVNKTIATVDGEVAAMTKLTAETSVLGSKVISGIAFGSDGKSSDFKVFADNFAVVSTDGRVEVPAFTSTMVGGKAVVGINGSLFVKNSISGDVIKANSTLSSPNIVGGQLNIGGGKFKVDTNGNVAMRANASSNVGMVITNERIDVYDENGQLRVRMGRLN